MSKKIMEFNLEDPWHYENGFYLTSHVTRIPKMLAHYELYKSITHLPGSIVECGVFKGASLLRFCTFREVLESPFSRKIIGFDIFGKFPNVSDEQDNEFITFFEEHAGDGISVEQLYEVLAHKQFNNVELVKGDVCETIDTYLVDQPELKIALLHIDVDVYKPTLCILEKLYDRVVKGGLIVLDDYATVAGETRAVDEFIATKDKQVEKLSISHVPCFIKK